MGNHCHNYRSFKVHPGGHSVSLVLLCSCWLDPAVNVNDSIWWRTRKCQIGQEADFQELFQHLMVSNHCHHWAVPKFIRLLLAKSNLKRVVFQIKNCNKNIRYHLAIRSQPDADIEDLVVVEQGESEGTVHSTMSAVSNQKAPILSDCKRSVHGSESWIGYLSSPSLQLFSCPLVCTRAPQTPGKRETVFREFQTVKSNL